MKSRLQSSSNILIEGWEFLACDPDAIRSPEELATLESPHWREATVPGTVALNVIRRDESLFDDRDAVDFDAKDYWYRCSFTADQDEAMLIFEGLATLADVWLNGILILRSENMFHYHEVDVADTLRTSEPSDNELYIRFSSLTAALAHKHGRGKWRSQLVAHRNLRYYRTSLLGRMPGICPPIAPVGPWAPISLGPRPTLEIVSSRVTPRLRDNMGEVSVDIQLNTTDPSKVDATVLLGDQSSLLDVAPTEHGWNLSGVVKIADVLRWWPHTHGTPHRYPLSLSVRCNSQVHQFELPAVGFREISLEADFTNFALLVNDQNVFCRGACWMPLDIVTLHTDKNTLRRALEQVRGAGMNMLRIPGTSVYEADEFYELCDELGILVWQDFMFARMDYPYADDTFRQSVLKEAKDVLIRLSHRPCLAVLCGGSEIDQQVAMLGLDAELAASDWFDRDLPKLCASERPDVVFSRNSPFGDEIPFYADTGVSHYFAVGGYRQGLHAAQLEPPRFATECLAFSIPPEPESIRQDLGCDAGSDMQTFPGRIPRDSGSDWDFQDVTDHYIHELFALDPIVLREHNPEKYLSVARIAVGETMRRVVEGWRQEGSSCRGSLIWTLRDLESGSGWGLVDFRGRPKAPYYFLKRAWQPVSMTIVDRSVNGLRVVIFNDRQEPLRGEIVVRLLKLDGKIVQQARAEVFCDGRTAQELSVDSLLGGFVDSSYAYRFGPPAFDLVHCKFVQNLADGSVVPLDSFYPMNIVDPLVEKDLGFQYRFERSDQNRYSLIVAASTFVQHAILDLPGCAVSDNYFSLVPDEERQVDVYPEPEVTQILGSLSALYSDRLVALSAEA